VPLATATPGVHSTGTACAYDTAGNNAEIATTEAPTRSRREKTERFLTFADTAVVTQLVEDII
jgi:hypothetical protein